MIEREFATFALQPTAGARVVVDRLPGNAPTWLFLHGLGSVRAGEKSTALFARAAARRRAAARFDFRGHGASSGTLGEVTVAEWLQDAATVLAAVAPAVLVGSSLGGLVAAHLAAARPELVRAVALLSPALGYLPRMRQRLDADGRLTTSEGRSFAVSARVLADAEAHDEATLPHRLPMPVFVAHGSDDVVVPVASSAAFVAAIPHAQKELLVVPDGDHRLNREIDVILRRAEDMFAHHGVA